MSNGNTHQIFLNNLGQLAAMATTRNTQLEELLNNKSNPPTTLVEDDSINGDAQNELFKNFTKQLEKQLQHSTPGVSSMSDFDNFLLGQLLHQSNMNKEMQKYGINVKTVFHNASPATLYEKALTYEKDSYITNTGALCCSSGAKTGRSPSDKRIVKEPSSEKDIWWGKVNFPLEEKSYLINRERAIDYLNLQERLYIVDGYAGWDPEFQVKIRVITTRAYHALFMRNMLIKPDPLTLKNFKPDFIIYNAGCFVANRYTAGVTSQTSVSLNLSRGEIVILGTQYAGEMKKGVLTVMMYLMPKCGQLPLHSSCNMGKNGDVTLFFGLSGTGKTTLSADPSRYLIGDDEHVWTNKGVFNIEGGCYAKCKDLSRSNEPEIYDAIKFGSVLENVTIDEVTREVDYKDISITENTRCAYPLEFISNSYIPAKVDSHPNNIILLTCDAFGVLPPVSLLTTEQTMYHFISGYTSKMAGTEQGIYEPTATFSACFGAPFLPLHPISYALQLAKKLDEHSTTVWMVNTGWVKGCYGSETGYRIPLKYTRKIIDAIHDNTLIKSKFQNMSIFGLKIPDTVDGIPYDILNPEVGWKDINDYSSRLSQLADLFEKNFEQYKDMATDAVIAAGPKSTSSF
uniref:phosphoenolpyruvate carboxykinase (ATP) n=1 Tax=Nephromyces sp. MMRI TaxID=2496275 RepID=A0A3Q8UC40_9APIC|nr:phosphoenolpyruvate carboxykinase [Nephromyces sp. MMRI]AZL94677.1 phosphoenolpyruvate carboxykinase [Nephromyces sp. MMRI]